MGNKKGFTKEDSRRIQSSSDQTGKNQDFKRYVQSKTDKQK